MVLEEILYRLSSGPRARRRIDSAADHSTCWNTHLSSRGINEYADTSVQLTEREDKFHGELVSDPSCGLKEKLSHLPLDTPGGYSDGLAWAST